MMAWGKATAKEYLQHANTQQTKPIELLRANMPRAAGLRKRMTPGPEGSYLTQVKRDAKMSIRIYKLVYESAMDGWKSVIETRKMFAERQQDLSQCLDYTNASLKPNFIFLAI